MKIHIPKSYWSIIFRPQFVMLRTEPQIQLPKEDIDDLYDDDEEEIKEDDDIKQELIILKKELNYFLTDILPFEWTTIKTELQFALNLLGGHTNAEFFGDSTPNGAVFEHVTFVVDEYVDKKIKLNFLEFQKDLYIFKDIKLSME